LIGREPALLIKLARFGTAERMLMAARRGVERHIEGAVATAACGLYRPKRVSNSGEVVKAE
jgi:hypothetical protein